MSFGASDDDDDGDDDDDDDDDGCGGGDDDDGVMIVMMMMMKSVESVRLLVILADVLGSILKGVVCHYLLLGFNICPFSLAMLYANVRHFFLSFFC